MSAFGLSRVERLGPANAKARYCKVELQAKPLINNEKTDPLNCLTIRLLTESLLVARQRIFVAPTRQSVSSSTRRVTQSAVKRRGSMRDCLRKIPSWSLHRGPESERVARPGFRQTHPDGFAYCELAACHRSQMRRGCRAVEQREAQKVVAQRCPALPASLVGWALPPGINRTRWSGTSRACRSSLTRARAFVCLPATETAT